MSQILTDEEVSAITGIGFEVTGRAIEQAILNKLREVEPVAWLHQTRTSSDVITDEVKMFLLRQYERWEFHSSVQRPSVCKAENYTKPLYLHPAPSVPEWQPIETAPMLKTVLLAVEFDGPGDWRIKCGSFYSNEWHVFGASWKPTHWMPLPKPPSARSK